MRFWVYIMTNYNRSTIYIGVTNDLYRRYQEHSEGRVEGFTKQYNCHMLLYYEEYCFIEEAIAREKQLKGWTRAKKLALIAAHNPTMTNLAEQLHWTTPE